MTRLRWSLWCTTRNGWAELLSRAIRAEVAGWSGVWVPDHLMPMDTGYRGLEGGRGSDQDREPMLEAWTALAALAASVPRVRLGALVSPTSHRHPAVLAKMATTVDQISGGRAVLGVGAGWQVNEHRAYGLRLAPGPERLDRLEEACAVLRLLLDQERSDFAGRHFHLDDAPLEPKALGPLPLVIGGGGERRTLRIAARFADEWNVWGTPEVIRRKSEVLERHCEDVGRDPGEIRRSANVLVHLADDGQPTESGRPTLTGSVDDVVEQAHRYAEVGVDELVVADFNRPDPGQARDLIEALGSRGSSST